MKDTKLQPRRLRDLTPLGVSRPLKIGLVVNRFPVVSETFIYNKVNGLLRAGHDVTVFASHERGDTAFYAGRKDSLSPRVVRLLTTSAPLRSFLNSMSHILKTPGPAMRLFARTRRLFGWRRSVPVWLKALPVATQRLDVVHFEFSGIAVKNEPILRLISGPAVFVSCRGTAEQVTPLVERERRTELGRVFQLVDRVHCVSDDMVQTAERWGLDRKKVFVNRPAIDIRLFNSRSRESFNDKVRAISVGRLHWDKGFVYALIALQQLRRRGLEIEYTIVGDGPDKTHLVYTADALGVTDVVRFAGALRAEAIQDELHSADIFLLPTVREGISNACLEAMAVGLPVISTPTGGMSEVIDDGINGLVVAARDPDGLAAQIEVLVRDPQMRHRLGCAARKTIEADFTLDRQISVFDREYRAVVEGNRS